MSKEISVAIKVDTSDIDRAVALVESLRRRTVEVNHDATVATVAREWVRLHREAARLRRERNAVDCEWAHPNEYDEVGRRTAPGIEPCFRDYSQPGKQPEDMPTTRPVPEWCPSCQRRNDLHLAYRATKQAEGVANRRLQALCRKEGTP